MDNLIHTSTIIVHNAEEDETGYWAEVEELPGCYGAGETLDEVEQDIREAIESHVLMLRDLGKPIPEGKANEDPLLRRWQIAVSA
jgi:predicted RNase H-like HicB family nuclease